MTKAPVAHGNGTAGGLIAYAGLLATSGCTGASVQSALHPAGPAAASIAWLWWFMFILGTLVFIGVMLLLVTAIMRRQESRQGPPIGTLPFVLLGGVAIPGVILFVLLILTLDTTVSLRTPDTDLTVEVVGHQWWWEVRYPALDIVDANEIHIPAGRPVRLELRSADVIHSFWVPALHGKMDLNPDHTNVFWIKADQEGVYRGQCAEFCGLQHALMAMEIVVHSSAAFDDWVEQRRRPTVELNVRQQRGKEIFLSSGCPQCHTAGDTTAEGEVGPDLTHVASRRTLGAGTLRNNRANLTGWLSNPQAIKPGNLMPPTYLSPDDLHALVDYLQSLK